MSNQSAAKPWVPPTSDQEFVFDTVDAIPAWADKSWATYSNGPALAVPTGDLFVTQPYTTAIAHKGDTVKYSVDSNSITVVAAPPPATPDEAPKRAVQTSAASLEDQLKSKAIEAGDLDDDAKAQVISRTPALKSKLEPDAAPAP